MKEIRYEASLAVAREILAVLGLPCQALSLGKVAFLVLDTLYACEAELSAADAAKATCARCLSSPPLVAACPPAAERCPRCGQPMGLAAIAFLN